MDPGRPGVPAFVLRRRTYDGAPSHATEPPPCHSIRRLSTRPHVCLPDGRSAQFRHPDLLTLTARPEVISLAGGLPATELVPRERIAEAAHRALADPRSVQYGETSGWAPLRETVAARRASRLGGRSTRPRSWSRTVRSRRQPARAGAPRSGDTRRRRRTRLHRCAAGVPHGTGRAGARRARRGRHGYRGTRAGSAGGVAAQARPHGEQLPQPSRRRAVGGAAVHLAALADEYGFWIIEDDPYGELWFDTPRPPRSRRTPIG